MAKISIIFSLALSSFLGLFHHGQVATSTATISTPQTAQNSSQITTAASSVLIIYNPDGTPTGLGKDTNYIYIGWEGSWIPIMGKVEPENYSQKYPDAHFTVNSNIDPITLVAIGDSYFKDKNRIYYSGPNITPVLDADPTTFHLVSVQLTYDAQDKNHKYLQGQIVRAASTTSKVPILDTQGVASPYYIENGHVYWNGSDDPNFVPTLLSNYPGSFVPLTSHDLYSDGHQIFQWDSVLSNDAAHFRFISSSTNPYVVAQDSLYYYMGSHQSNQVTPTQSPEDWLRQTSGGIGQ